MEYCNLPCLLLFAMALMPSMVVSAQEPSEASASTSNEDLAAQANDPTAALMSVQLGDWYTATYHGINDSANQLVFLAAIPLELGSTKHIFRITQLFVTDSPSDAEALSILRFSV